MKDRNICKFVTDAPSESIKIHNFIFESDSDTMKNSYKLDTCRIMLINEGSAVCTFDGKEYLVPSGSVVFGFKGECLSVAPRDQCEYMYISFSGTRAESLFARFKINKENRVFSGFDGVIPLWHDSLSRANEINIDLASESILLYTFSLLAKDNSFKNDLINRIIKITEEQFTSPELSISEISDTLSYNSKYLSHLFKTKMGVTYSEYLRNLRIKYAVSLLDHGIDSVKNISYLSGFSDPLYFSSVFKKVVGVSPKEYKKAKLL